jgi:translocation and assembly module TamA
VLTAAATNLGGTASLQPGYTLSALLTLPNWQRTDQSLIFNVSAIDQWLEAYTQRAIRAGATLERRLTQITPDLTASVGVEATQAHVEQEGASYDYLLLQTPLGLRFDNTHNTFDPTHGFRASLSLTPSQNLGSPGSTFVIAQASGSAYLDVGALLSGTPGRSVLAARVLVGGVDGATTFDIPPDQRLYAGGGGTVRGYRFQSIGPQFADSRPVGGTSVDVGSVELRQRFGESYGAVAFVDAGQVGSNGVPFEGQFRVGAGLGARYYTAFGPIRVDFAVPLTSHPGSDAFELYLGIGQAF